MSRYDYNVARTLLTTPADPCVPCPCVCQHGNHDNGCMVACSALRDAERREAETPLPVRSQR